MTRDITIRDTAEAIRRLGKNVAAWNAGERLSESFPPPTGENRMNTGKVETAGIEPAQGSRHDLRARVLHHLWLAGVRVGLDTCADAAMEAIAAHGDPVSEWSCCGQTFTGTGDFISGARAAHVCPPEDVPDAEAAYALGRAAERERSDGGRLRHARQTAGFTQEALAARAQVAAATVRRAELGATAPRRLTRHALADALRVPAAQIWPYDDEADDEAGEHA